MISSYLKSLSISDIILILFCLIIAFLIWRNFGAADQRVYIYKEDALWGDYPLSKDRIIEIDEHNSIEIKAGKARMLHSDCPDQRCVKQGFNNNMPIICLPNRVVLEFQRDQEERRLILQ
jgi:hypothetical protein